MKYIKVYVAVTVFIDEAGRMLPLSITFEGKEYIIDKVTDVRRTPPEHVGGLITHRYDLLIKGVPKKIYRETTGRWFMEVLDRNT